MSLSRFLICLATMALAVAVDMPQAESQAPASEHQRTDVTSVPGIPAGVHDAMQSRSYDDAIALIDKAIDDPDSKSKDYLLYLKGLAQTESKKYDAAIATFKKIQQEDADGPWVTRARFGQANVYVLQRQYIDAGAIYQQEAERLLSRGRKDELAGVYLEFADKYFEGVPADDPSKEKKPDYKQALTYYGEVVKLGPTVSLRQKVEFRIARCHEELGAYDEALKAYQQYLSDHGGDAPASGKLAPPEMRANAWFNLGAVELKVGQRVAARKTWQELIAAWNQQQNEDEKISLLLADAEFRLAHTYGMPAPQSIGDLELGVAAAQAFLQHHPGSKLAAKAELEIAQAYSRFGRHRQAVDRMTSLINNPAYKDSAQVPVARRLLGQAYLTQRQFDEAIDAWKEFLEQHPTDREWAKVQKWIVDAEFAKASFAQYEKRYGDARELWQTFLNKYPLDPRAPGVLYRFGQMKLAAAIERHDKRVAAAVQQGRSAHSVDLNDESEKLFEEAIVDWRRVVQKYPGHQEASHASFLIGVTLEDRLGRLPEALVAYKEVRGDYADKAKDRIARLTSPLLEIATERKFRSDEKPRIKLTTRNLKKVSVKAYRIDMTDYFRKMHLASGVETLDIALIDPDSQFDHDVADYQQYQRIDGDIDIPIDGPGVTAVTVSSEKLEATTMLVVSDLDVIVKASRNELFLFAQNMRTGKPAVGASVLISDGSEVFAEELTGDNGVLQKAYKQLKSVDDLRVFAVDQGHMASTVNSLNGLDFAIGLTPRGYLFTERPAYRAGQLVNIKGVVRWVDGDRFTFQPGEKFKLDIYDARGRQIQTTEVKLSGFGTINDHVVLPESSPQGDYRVHLHRSSTGSADATGSLSFETQFKVTDYKLEPIELSIELEKDVYFRGEKVKGEIAVRYYYGTPLAGETVTYRLADGETVSAQTDADGKIPVEFDTQRFAESQPLQLVVQYPVRGLSRAQTVYLATRGFEVTASTIRDVYINGETFEVLLQVTDPAKKPVATKLSLELLEVTNVNGQQGERLVQTFAVQTDEESGQGQQTLSVDSGGMYLVRATGVDQFGNDVSGQHRVRISGEQDSVRLRILADHHRFHVGEDATIKLHWREQPALALVTFDGATVLGYQLVDLKSGENDLLVPMEADFAPNIFLSVAVMNRNQFHAASTELQVTQKLNVKLTPEKEAAQPGEDVLVEIEVTDPQGKPLQAELSLAMVQTNLLDTFGDVQGAIDEFFSAGRRKVSVRQATSCTFRYQPSTRGVSQFLLAEAERIETLAREVRALAMLGGRANQPTAEGESANEAEISLSDDRRLEQSLNDLGDVIALQESEQISGVEKSQYFGQRTGRRVVPMIRYKTEIRDGKKFQIPYTVQVEQSYAINAPAVVGDFAVQSRGQMTLGFGQAGQAGQVATGIVQMPSSQRLQLSDRWESLQNRDGRAIQGYAGEAFFDQSQGFNMLASDGTVMAVNDRDQAEIIDLVANRGAQLFPMFAHAETAFWNPSIVTDQQGKAMITIPMPNRSTAWRIRSKSVTTNTLAGQSSIELITKKDLFGELKLPLAYVIGDQTSVPVEVHCLLEGERKIQVKLKTTLGDKSTEQTKTVEVSGPGVSKLSFPVEIDGGQRAEFSLEVTDGDNIKDTLTQTVAIRPFGFPVYATASGSAAQSTLALIKFDPSLPAQDPSLEIVIGADVNRALLDSVLGDRQNLLLRCGLPEASGIERNVSDILGGVALLEMIGDARDADTPQAQSLIGRISGAIAQLVSSQRDDGGWNWVGRSDGNADALLSARIMWALSAARKSGFVVSQEQFGRGQAYLKSSFAATPQSALERQTILLQAMAVSECGDFAFANRLYRERNRLSMSARTHLALALAALNHAEMAVDLLELVSFADQKNDSGKFTALPWMRSEVELRAIYLLALEEVDPRNPVAEKTADWLLAARVGARWPVEKSNGPAISALARWHARTQHVSEKYKLAVSVNDQEIESFVIDPTTDGNRRLTIDNKLLNSDKPQRIEFKLDGRGTFSYSAVLTGFVPADKIASTSKSWKVDRRYQPAQRMLAGVALPRGFDVVNGSYESYINPLTQLTLGDRGEVTLSPRRYNTSSRADAQYDYLVLSDPIPAGCTVLNGSVNGSFERFEIQPGQITFYLGDTRNLGDIHYTLVGYVPGDYRAPQSVLRSFYDPAQFAISTVKALTVLAAGETTDDEYRLTPDELYHFGERYFAKQQYEQAHEHLSTLFDTWRLDADKYKNTVNWLFHSSLAMGTHPDTVKYFEILKERFPDVELSFEDILNVAKSYREIGEYERSYLVYRATVEGSFERESQVAGFLNARGQFVRSVQAMERLLRDYPRESYVATASYALAQEVYRRAADAASDEPLKQAGITRVDLINASIEMLDHFVTVWPEDPANDQASFALATALIDLDQYDAAITRSEQYADRYPSSRLLDSFWYMIGYCHFELEHHQQALEMCRKVAEATIPVPESGGTRAADNKWEAVYIMGQIYHSLGKAAEAINQYTRVGERFADAAEAIKFFSRKEIAMDEVTTIKPADPKRVMLRFRNLPETAIKVYRIDLMKFGLMQRNLDRITAINLAGIKPYHEETVMLGDGKDYRDREQELSLPLNEEGAYLVVCRGENLYASGLVLVSPLTLLVGEDEISGRVRVSVKDTTDDSFVDDVHVKVIGSANDDFESGDTDLRGLFIADDIRGTCTVIAVSDQNRYAFYRGEKSLQGVVAANAAAESQQQEMEPSASAPAVPQKQSGKAVLGRNLFEMNGRFQEVQKDNYDGLLNNDRQGVKSKEAY